MWKWIGLAGLVGVVAVGATVGAKQVQRSRREYADADPAELRDRLHARFAEATSPPSGQSSAP
jgi:hypothetical protein